MKFAAMLNGIIAFFDPVDSPVPAGVDAIEISDDQWQVCLSNPGYTVVAQALVPPTVVEPTLDDLKSSLKSSVAAKRYEVETSGIAVDGVALDTSLESQNRITSVIANATVAGVTEVDFKATSGWVHLTIKQVTSIAAAIGLHVQACYTAEKVHDTAIDALETVEAAQAYDITTGWPT